MNVVFRLLESRSPSIRRLGVYINQQQATNSRNCCSMSVKSRQTAGILIIGDEILKGHTKDTNSHFLCQQLYDLGVKVEKIEVISDDLAAIADEVARFSSLYTHVLTSGGIGPTHDDITFEGVARAFNEDIIAHPELVHFCREYFGMEKKLDSPELKIAHVPRSSRLFYGINQSTGMPNPYPLVCVRNVYVFPGVPSILKQVFLSLKDKLFHPSESTAFHTRDIFVNRSETAITNSLNSFNDAHKKTVVLGSYPDFQNNYFKVKLTLETNSKATLDEACDRLIAMLPKDSVISYNKDSITNAADGLKSLLGAPELAHIGSFVGSSVTAIEEALSLYPLSSLCIGFNGGKDCTALLHLVYAVIKRKFPQRTEPLQILYIDTKRSFPELDTFIQESVQRYDLKVLSVTGHIKEALEELKIKHPDISAVFMGTRKSDPRADNLGSFSLTDADWPQYMRINPMLEWSYHDVWQFIRTLSLPYCRLYDRGYTSVGSKLCTDPNPALRYINTEGVIRYHPAYMLQDGLDERTGRKHSNSSMVQNE